MPGETTQDGKSVFAEFYRPQPFFDRYAASPDCAVDVIIPVMHTNELWRPNLHSIYREIPVNRLVISDDGCVDDSIAIAREYPRVKVLDHRKFISLGFSLRKLIEAVETEWFVYLHSDVYLAQGWFERMRAESSHLDWFESSQHTAILAELPHDYDKGVPRPFSGAQMGRRAAFDGVLPTIDDDFLYRNEDIILAHLVQKAGFRYGRAAHALIYHQQMEKKSRWLRSIAHVDIKVRTGPDEELRESRMQLYGLLKYMDPDPGTFEAHCMMDYIEKLRASGHLSMPELRAWVEDTKPAWWPIIQRASVRRRLQSSSLRMRQGLGRGIRNGVERVLRLLGL